jgi:hypothetical protein
MPGSKQTSESKSKRKPGRPRDERVNHIIEITDWNWDLSFGLGCSKWSTDPYNDFRHLNIVGTLLRPLGISPSQAKLTVFPDNRLVESERQSQQPKAVGWISHRGKQYSANFHLPADALGYVLQMLLADRYRYVIMDAGKSFRGEADIRHYRFSGTVNEDELSS